MPFKPGQSGNPGGRPKRTEALATAISEMDTAHRLRLEYIAAHGEHKDSVAAIKLLWAYAHGNPTQPVTGEGGGPLQIQTVSLAETLANLIRR